VPDEPTIDEPMPTPVPDRRRVERTVSDIRDYMRRRQAENNGNGRH
jgi:hypothetical protein